MDKDLSYYQNLITSAHRDKPKFMAWLTVGLDKLQAASSLADALPSLFDIDQAAGVQLECLGEIIGRSRTVNFQPTDGSSPVLNDDNYRLILKAKVIQNNWKGTIPELEAAWESLFPGSHIYIHDNQNMTMRVAVGGITSLMERDLVLHGYIVPKPQSVRINYYHFGDDPYPNFEIDMFIGCLAMQSGSGVIGLRMPDGADVGIFEGCLTMQSGSQYIGTRLPDGADVNVFAGAKTMVSGMISIHPKEDKEWLSL